MYSVIVERSFPAAHKVRMPDGAWEEPHSHDWLVRAHFRRGELDEHEMVVDFCAVSDALGAVLAPLAGRLLNELPEFRGRIPTAEVVARWLFDALRDRGFEALFRVEVTEAPGCIAAYERLLG